MTWYCGGLAKPFLASFLLLFLFHVSLWMKMLDAVCPRATKLWISSTINPASLLCFIASKFSKFFRIGFGPRHKKKGLSNLRKIRQRLPGLGVLFCFALLLAKVTIEPSKEESKKEKTLSYMVQIPFHCLPPSPWNLITTHIITFLSNCIL